MVVDDIVFNLYLFIDISKRVYRVCVYCVIENILNLIIVKNWVVFIKIIILFCLELIGVVVGVKLFKNLNGVVNVKLIILWCDSKIVFYWFYLKKLMN